MQDNAQQRVAELLTPSSPSRHNDNEWYAQHHLLIWDQYDQHIRWQPGQRLHHLFEQSVDRLLNAGLHEQLAVESDEACWSYTELDQRANQLARYLIDQGIGNGDVVALLFDKSAYSYLAMLAVLKAHAAYVPLDPGFPQERIEFITADAGARRVLTVSGYQSQAAVNELPVDSLDQPDALLRPYDSSRLSPAELPDTEQQLCYIIYTSGSTGKPKGVPINQASICNFVNVARETYGYQRSDRVYQGLTLAFDFAVEEIWVPLIVGATLLPNQTGTSLLGDDLADFLESRRITAMCCVPTLLATIDRDLPALRFIIVSGEACPQDLIRRWHTDNCQILNAYGPTEATVTATVAWSAPQARASIGKPLPTYTILILEPGSQRVLPFGEEGEIGIAGIGVAEGYLNRDDQTRKAFIEDFVGIPNNPSARIYRTGDLGCINADGNVEYRGRIDLQVKVRGYRIELTEIESVLLAHPDVAQAVVDTFEPREGVKELVAYYTPRQTDQTVAVEQLLEHLRANLPGYMVPAWFEQLQHIPMLASDKADRKQLPRPGSQRMQLEQRDYVAPVTELERQLADTLGGILGSERISTNDHFFDHLGANSLLMAQYTAKLRKELGIHSIAMRDIYAHPTIQALAERLDADSSRADAEPRSQQVHQASLAAYVLTGLAQLATALLLTLLGGLILWEGTHYVYDATSLGNGLLRAFAVSLLSLTLATALPIAAKWLLIGRFRVETFPLWTRRYFRFWLVKTLIRGTPLRLFAGTPIYTAYYKALGADISWDANIQTAELPITADLTRIGADTVIAPDAILTGYHVESGYLTIGSHQIGESVYIGCNSVIDIDSTLHDGCQLGHASSVARGQQLEPGLSYHGVPARPADCAYPPLDSEHRPGSLRKWLFSLSSLMPVLVISSLLMWLPHYLLNGHQTEAELSDALVAMTPVPTLADLPRVAAVTAGLYLATLLSGLLLIGLLPRLLNRFITAGTLYPLYGWHHLLQRMIRLRSYSRFYNYLFGDSSMVVYYLKWTGYQIRRVIQTGSNFGMDQRHDNPLLCHIGEGSMVSDGIKMVNTRYGAGSFRCDEVMLGKHSFFGNALVWPAAARVGDNCLIGTKTLVPTSGPLRENVGLLGSPSFEIPRSVSRDLAFEQYKDPTLLQQRLTQKNRHNAISMGLFVLVNFVALLIEACLLWYTHPYMETHGALYMAGVLSVTLLWGLPYYLLMERLVLGFGRLKPRYCSIYDEQFWQHERFWKISSFTQMLTKPLNGTPFKALALRALGVRVGKRLYDDGGGCPEHTLLSIGDYVTINAHAFIQPHSLEDGSFKSDHIRIDDSVTIGSAAFIHYGSHIETGTLVETDAFLMKGESTGQWLTWEGNPAQARLRSAG